MILARSPFYVPIFADSQGLSIDRAIIEIRVWDGDKTNIPTNANYSEEKRAIDGDVVFEISNYLREFFEKVPDSPVQSNWVAYRVFLYEIGEDNPVSTNPLYTTQLALDGFGFFRQGQNPQYIIGNNVYPQDSDYNPLSISSVYVEYGQEVIYTFALNGDGIVTHDEYRINYNDGTGQDYDLASNINSNQSNDKVITVYGDQSTKLIDNITIVGVAENFVIKVKNIKSCNNGKTVSFFNKDGLLSNVYMSGEDVVSYSTKKNTTNVNTQTKTFDTLERYNPEQHNRIDYNINGQESIMLNSGWVDEIDNNIFQQMILSDYIWINMRPVVLNTKSITFKKDKPNELINYQIEFDYASDILNNI